MNQKELAEKAKEMQKDYSNIEIAELLGVRLEDLTAALTYRDSAVKVQVAGEEPTVEKKTKVEPKKRGPKKKS